MEFLYAQGYGKRWEWQDLQEFWIPKATYQKTSGKISNQQSWIEATNAYETNVGAQETSSTTRLYKERYQDLATKDKIPAHIAKEHQDTQSSNDAS